MRLILLTAFVSFASLAQAPAQAMPTMQNLTYPEPGSFCGLLKLCRPDDAEPKEEQ